MEDKLLSNTRSISFRMGAQNLRKILAQPLAGYGVNHQQPVRPPAAKAHHDSFVTILIN
jgi:hypothetical protein